MHFKKWIIILPRFNSFLKYDFMIIGSLESDIVAHSKRMFKFLKGIESVVQVAVIVNLIKVA
jgi:hypothetical protein